MSDQFILVTGSQGLIGQTLVDQLRARGRSTRGFDLRHALEQDVRKLESLRQAVEGCVGIVHLAAVSRVVWGEQDPIRCRETNIEGTSKLIRVALEANRRPWLLFASSREVYGDPPRLPAIESDPLAPINEYGRTKVAAETMIQAAVRSGLTAATVRLSNVYGRIDDHADRVVPAFARAAAQGAPMRIDGADHLFDFTHVEDTVRGLLAMIDLLDAGEHDLPPIHLLTGRATSLGELAKLANRAGGGGSQLIEAPPRNYDVARFWGDPARSRALLGWSASIGIADGIAQLVADFTREQSRSPAP